MAIYFILTELRPLILNQFGHLNEFELSSPPRVFNGSFSPCIHFINVHVMNICMWVFHEEEINFDTIITILT